MKNNTLTNVNVILFNIVFLWPDMLDLLPQQCILYPSGTRLNSSPCRTAPQTTWAHCHRHISGPSTHFSVLKKGNNRWEPGPENTVGVVAVYNHDRTLHAWQPGCCVRECYLWSIHVVSKANQHSIAHSLPYLYACNRHSSPVHCPRLKSP